MWDLRQLELFVAVAEGEHVGRAAERLHISQSPLSRRIRELEDDLGLALFERRKKRLHLTDAGKALLVEARGLLQRSARLEQTFRARAAGQEGPLTIGYVEGAVHAGVLPRQLAAFKKRNPATRIELVQLNSAQQFAALEEHRIDVGFSYRPPEPGLSSSQVHDEPFCLALSSADPLAKGPLTSKRLAGLPLIARPEATSPHARRELLAACERAGFQPDIRCEATDPSVVLQLVAAGLGAAVVQRSLGGPSGVVRRELPRGFDWRLKIFCVHRAEPGALLKRFLSGPARGT